MKTLVKRTGCMILALSVITTVFLSGCKQMSELIIDKSAGMNGSFEHTKSGLPVNWLLYTPKTVETGDFRISLDTTEFKDGKQSLKFSVSECSAVGGWLSPGFCNEYKAKPGETYKVSLWVKNVHSEFFIQIGGISAFKGQYKTVVKSRETIDTWRLFECKYTIPQKMNAIRFEMNILQPGVFWIDDVKIEKSDDNK
jgi:hypothetical protein